jgi:hypothetical protein
MALQERRRKGLADPLHLFTNIYCIIHQYLFIDATYRVNQESAVGAKKSAVCIGLHNSVDIGE